MTYQNKYKLPDGREVSRQRIWQLKHPEQDKAYKKTYRAKLKQEKLDGNKEQAPSKDNQ